MATSELVVGASILAPGQPELHLCDDHTKYRLDSESRNERTVSYRKQEVQSPFVEGTYLISAVRENVVENVGVWVYATSQALLSQRVNDLCDRLEAPRFEMRWAYSDMVEQWDCQAAGYTIRSQREFQHAMIAQVKIQVPRLPRVRYTYPTKVVTR